MGHEAPDRHPVELHWQDEEAEPLAARRTRPWRGWVALAGVVAVLVVVPSLVQRGTVPGPIEPQQPNPTPTSATTSRVVVPDLGPAILGVTDRWELFALGDNSVTQIQLAASRITTTYSLRCTAPARSCSSSARTGRSSSRSTACRDTSCRTAAPCVG